MRKATNSSVHHVRQKVVLVNRMEKRIVGQAREAGLDVSPEVHQAICQIADVILAEARKKNLSFFQVLRVWGSVYKAVSVYFETNCKENMDGLAEGLGFLFKKSQEQEFFSSDIATA